jgi:succinyl-diaminopimelate desuccinylase
VSTRRNARSGDDPSWSLAAHSWFRNIRSVHSAPNPGPDLAERLLAWLQPREDEMAALLAQLVSVRTENPPGTNYRDCVDLLERNFSNAGLACERHEFPASRTTSGASNESAPSLTASFGNGNRTLYFQGHYDVVPAQSVEQFQPVQKEHFVFGRGACDMKGGIVSMLYAIRALQECRVELDGKIALTLVPDEETGGARGSAWLAARGLLGLNAIGMLMPEPTSGVVWNANRGAISLRVTVLGKSAHVGLQHRGENAFEQMVRVVDRLRALKREVEQRTTAYRLGGDQNRNSILMIGGESGGGANFNVVPEQSWFTVDRRINPEENFETERQSLIGVLEQCRRDGIRLEWEIFQEGSAAVCSAEEKLGRALTESVKAITGEAPQFEMCPGLLEIRFYSALKIPAYAYGPGLLSVAHGPNEYVDIRKVRDCAAIYALTAIEMLNEQRL